MKYAVGLGSAAVICILSFIKIVSGIEKLRRWDTHTDTQTHGQQGDLISLLLFFKRSKVD
jgi:hypothetical protein